MEIWLSQKLPAARWQHFPQDRLSLSHLTKSQLRVGLGLPCCAAALSRAGRAVLVCHLLSAHVEASHSSTGPPLLFQVRNECPLLLIKLVLYDYLYYCRCNYDYYLLIAILVRV